MRGPSVHRPADRGPHWRLPDNPNLAWLRSRVEELQQRYAAGDSEAVELVSGDDPSSPRRLPLAHAQRVLARALGFAGWAELRDHLATIERYSRWPEPFADDRSEPEPTDLLRLACLSYTRWRVADLRAAAELVAAGGLATDAWTLAATGRADDLARLLGEHPELADTEGGPYRWPPLLYLCYARLGAQRGDPVRTARVLLTAGADPDAGYLWHGLTSPFTALTGAFGGGERAEPPHPDSSELARVLLDAGADPNDNQTLYNRMFTPADDHLRLLLPYGLGTARPSVWRDRLGSAYPSSAEMVGEQLRSAAERGFIGRVRVLLEHRVDPNTTGYHPILGDQNAYEVAVRSGHREIAALLAAAGGRSDRLDAVDLLLADLLSGTDVSADPELIGEAVRRQPAALADAVAHGQDAALPLLLAHGFDVNGSAHGRRTALHLAAIECRPAIAGWLLDHGADPTSRDREHDATPAGWAAYAGHRELALLLDPVPAADPPSTTAKSGA
ncbi:MAG: ankyrin repeat domain-containing protein [Propionibacteriaceae bacterium]